MSRPRALLANEAGGGRGHVTTLATVARALGRKVTLVSALARDAYAKEVSDLCESSFKPPLLSRTREDEVRLGFRGCATWADGLATLGLADETRIRRGLRFWRNLIVDQDISLLVADHAPLALWAARGLRDEGWDMRVVNIGIGYTVPPSDLLHFPPFLPDVLRTLHDEAATLAVLNRVGAEFDLAPLPRLSALYAVDLSLVTSFAFLDPYVRTRDPAVRIPPLVPASRVKAGAGRGIFVYFSTTELADPALVDALACLSVPRRGYLPSAPSDVHNRLLASGMELLDQPASAHDIADYARLIVHAAPHGTISLAALAGLPQVGIPQHQEQLYNARTAAARGILRIGQRGNSGLGSLIAEAYADERLAAAALAFAEPLRISHPWDPEADLSARIDPLLFGLGVPV
ncbi:MAG: hypothetical protein MUE52_06695 [Tabrizicola sp.]|jgi:hypothetical protein|nr:hypothetical protein [Tabrizicola sp.]